MNYQRIRNISCTSSSPHQILNIVSHIDWEKELSCSSSELTSPVPLQLFSLQSPSVKMSLTNFRSRWMLTRALS